MRIVLIFISYAIFQGLQTHLQVDVSAHRRAVRTLATVRLLAYPCAWS